MMKVLALLLVFLILDGCKKKESAEQPATSVLVNAPQASEKPKADPLLAKLTDFVARAEKAPKDLSAVNKLVEEGNQLATAQIEASNRMEILKSKESQGATAALGSLKRKQRLLECAGQATGKEVGACVDSMWQDDWVLGQMKCSTVTGLWLKDRLREALLSVVGDINEHSSCRAGSRDGGDIEIVMDLSSALSSESERDRKKWLEERKKALSRSWTQFQKSKSSDEYWGLVGQLLRGYCEQIEDGDELDTQAIFDITQLLDALGGKSLEKLVKTTSYRSLLKDHASEKGKWMTVEGKILSIRKDGEFFQGQVIDSNYNSYLFATHGSTDGIYEGSRIKLSGIVTQIQTFDTQGGGRGLAPVILGYLSRR